MFITPSSFSPHSPYETVLQFGGLGPIPPGSEMNADWVKLISIISFHSRICFGNRGLSQSTLFYTQGLDRVFLWMLSTKLLWPPALPDMKEDAHDFSYRWQLPCVSEGSWPLQDAPNKERFTENHKETDAWFGDAPLYLLKIYLFIFLLCKSINPFKQVSVQFTAIFKCKKKPQKFQCEPMSILGPHIRIQDSSSQL